MQDFLDLVDDLYLSLITDELSGGSSCPDWVLKRVELPVSLDDINIESPGTSHQQKVG